MPLDGFWDRQTNSLEVSFGRSLRKFRPDGHHVVVDSAEIDRMNLVSRPHDVGHAVIILKKRRIDPGAFESGKMRIRAVDPVGDTDEPESGLAGSRSV